MYYLVNRQLQQFLKCKLDEDIIDYICKNFITPTHIKNEIIIPFENKYIDWPKFSTRYKTTEDNFAYAYFAGALKTEQYNLIKTQLTNTTHKFSYENFVNQNYTTLVTAKSLKELNMLVNNVNHFVEILKFEKTNLRAYILKNKDT